MATDGCLSTVTLDVSCDGCGGDHHSLGDTREYSLICALASTGSVFATASTITDALFGILPNRLASLANRMFSTKWIGKIRFYLLKVWSVHVR